MSFRDAHQWGCRLYARRVCGMTPPEQHKYHGDFDCEAIANAAPLPPASDLLTHQACWNEFHRMFRHAWGKSE